MSCIWHISWYFLGDWEGEGVMRSSHPLPWREEGNVFLKLWVVSLKSPLRGIFHSSPVLTAGRVKNRYRCAWLVYPSEVKLLLSAEPGWRKSLVLFYITFSLYYSTVGQDMCASKRSAPSIFICIWLAHFFFIRNNGETQRKKYIFRVRKTTISSSFLIILRFHEYRYKSCIVIFALRVA